MVRHFIDIGQHNGVVVVCDLHHYHISTDDNGHDVARKKRLQSQHMQRAQMYTPDDDTIIYAMLPDGMTRVHGAWVVDAWYNKQMNTCNLYDYSVNK